MFLQVIHHVEFINSIYYTETHFIDTTNIAIKIVISTQKFTETKITSGSPNDKLA